MRHIFKYDTIIFVGFMKRLSRVTMYGHTPNSAIAKSTDDQKEGIEACVVRNFHFNQQALINVTIGLNNRS